MEAMIRKASELKVEQIKTWLTENVASTDANLNLVFDAMLSALERKITDAEFVVFANELEGFL